MIKCKQDQPCLAKQESNQYQQWWRGQPERERWPDGSKKGKVVYVAGVTLKAGSGRSEEEMGGLAIKEMGR